MAERKKTGTEKTGGTAGTRTKPAIKKKPAAKKKRKARSKLTLQEVTTERYLTLIQGWYMDGATNQDVADRLHISRDTLHRWSKQSPELLDVMKHSREIADYKVENSLYKKALGYTVALKKPIKVRVDDYDEKTRKKIGSHEEVVTAEEEVHVPADTAAIIFWLKNRLPEKWRQKEREIVEDDSESGIVMLPSMLELDEDEESQGGQGDG